MSNNMFNVLVADDEENFREIFKDLLRSDNLNVLSAGAGNEVIRKILDYDVHLLLLDKKFPTDDDGMQTLKKVKEMKPELEVIMLTAYPDAESNLEAMRMGAHCYLHKARDVKLISETVRHLIEIIQLKQENQRLLRELQEKNKWLEEMKETFRRWNAILIKKISNLRSELDSDSKNGSAKSISKNTELLILSFIHELNNRFQVAEGIFSCANVPPETEDESPLNHLKSLFDQLSDVTSNFCDLAFGKTENVEFDLAQVATKAFGAARYFSRNRIIALRRDIATNLPKVRGQPRLLLDAILNLLKNAIEAVQILPEEETPTVILKVFHQQPQEVVLEVLNSGPELSPEIVESLFKPFFTTKGDSNSNGIGLSWVQKAVKAHDGNITFDRADGALNCFRIVIPITDEVVPVKSNLSV